MKGVRIKVSYAKGVAKPTRTFIVTCLHCGADLGTFAEVTDAGKQQCVKCKTLVTPTIH